jgi:hypothetical protein
LAINSRGNSKTIFVGLKSPETKAELNTRTGCFEMLHQGLWEGVIAADLHLQDGETSQLFTAKHLATKFSMVCPSQGETLDEL